jgi:hypothetical protein
MATDFNTALSTPLPEGMRRIVLLVSWASYVLLSIVIVVCAIGIFYESGIKRPDKSNPFYGIEEIKPDGTKSTFGDEREWSKENISPFVLLIIPGAIVAVIVCRWLSFKAFPQVIGYIWAVLWWVVMGFKKDKG